MQRLLMRWRLYANRLHNARVHQCAMARVVDWVTVKCSFRFWKTSAQVQQHSRCRAHSTDTAFKCGDRLADALTTACFIRSQLSVFHPLSAAQSFKPTESAEALQFNVPVVTSSLSEFPVADGHPELDSPGILDLSIQGESILTKFLRRLCSGEDTTTRQQGHYHPNTRHNLLASWGNSEAWRPGVTVSVEIEVRAPSRARRGNVVLAGRLLQQFGRLVHVDSAGKLVPNGTRPCLSVDQSVHVVPRGNFGFPGGLPWQCVRVFKNSFKTLNRSSPLTVALYSSLLVLSSASSTGGLDVLESEPRMNVVTAEDTSPSIVRNSKEDVGLHLTQWIVFVCVTVFVSMLLWIQGRAHYSRRKTQSSLLHPRLRQALERRFLSMKLRIPERWFKIV